jgi:hypothetical protein
MSYQRRLIVERREEIAQEAQAKLTQAQAGPRDRPAKVFVSQTDQPSWGSATWSGNRFWGK